MADADFQHIRVSMVKDAAVLEIRTTDVQGQKLAQELSAELALVTAQEWTRLFLSPPCEGGVRGGGDAQLGPREWLSDPSQRGLQGAAGRAKSPVENSAVDGAGITPLAPLRKGGTGNAVFPMESAQRNRRRTRHLR